MRTRARNGGGRENRGKRACPPEILSVKKRSWASAKIGVQGNPKDPAAITLVGGFPFRAFEIDGGHVTISGVTISGGGGVEQGGGIEAQDADLTVE